MRKICCVFNYPPLYRLPIFSAMSDVLKCDFYFGDNVFEPIKKFDVTTLKGYKGTLKAVKIYKDYIWHNNVKVLFSKEYTDYIVTGSTNYLITWILLFYCKLTGKKIYLWSHGTTNEKYSVLSLFKDRLFYTKANGIFLYGSYCIPNMLKLGCKKENLFVLHNSLDTNFQTKLYNRLSSSNIYNNYFKNNFPTFIYIGRLQKRKKIDQIIYAIDILKSKGVLTNLVIVGKSTDADDLEKLVETLNLNKNVWFYGPCYDEEKNAELIYNSCACVSPGNVGLTAIHSLSYGTPVVTNNNFKTQMPEFESIKVGKTGSFFKENNIDDLAEQMKFWSTVSEQKRQEIRDKCRNMILNEWSVDYQIEVFSKTLLNRDENYDD